MVLIRYKNQSEYAFLVWMNASPNSHHPLDEERFYQFVKTLAVYRNKKWIDYAYFRQRVLAHSTYFDEEKIDEYWEKLQELLAYHKVAAVPTVGHDSSTGDYGYYQDGANNGKMYRVKISQAEYLHGGATKNTMLEAEYFGS
jgi:hypothetical protein